MKFTKAIVPILLFVLSQNVCGQWVAKNIGTNNLNCIKYVTASTLFVGGTSGIYKSINGGQSFSQTSLPLATLAIYDIHFTDTNNGFAVGNNFIGNDEIIIKTNNGGLNWSIVYTNSGGSLPRSLNSVHFVNSQIGFAVGNNGRILKTTNGGINWFALNNSFNRTFEEVNFVNSSVGYVAGDGIILKTSNGGLTWTASTSTQYYHSVQFLSADTGFVVSSNSIQKTVNGGVSWLNASANISSGGTKIKMLNKDSGFIATDRGILKTANGGINWYLQPSSSSSSTYYGLDFVNLTIGGAVGLYGKALLTTSCGDVVARNDASLTSILLPTQNSCPGTYPLALRVKNNGLNILNSVIIKWMVNGISQPSFLWNGTLYTDSNSATINIGSFYFQGGTNNVKIWTEKPNGLNDDNSLNDTFVSNYSNNRLSGIYTVGGTNPNFSSLNAAISALLVSKPCGIVNFKIRDGVYYLNINNLANLTDSTSKGAGLIIESESGDSTKVVIIHNGQSEGVCNTPQI